MTLSCTANDSVEQVPITPKVLYFVVLQWKMALHYSSHDTIKSGSKSVSTQECK